MIKKRFVFVLTTFLGLSLFLAGCTSNKASISDNMTNDGSQDTETEETDRRYEIYVLAKQSGYTGTYEEWLESIRGDSIELQVSDGNIQWKYTADSNWINLISLSELTGTAREVEFSATATHVIWRYVGDTEWKNLFEITKPENGKSAYDIAKEAGFTGSEVEWLDSLKGASIELRVNDGSIEWKNTNDTEWEALIELSDLVGKNGKEIELSTTPTYIVWRYIGDSEWINLVEIPKTVDGKSAYEIAKDLGFTGSEVEWLDSLKGASIELRVNDGAIEWKNEDDTNWTSLINLSELAGKDGKEIELSTTPTHIVWRYNGDSEWINLLEIPKAVDGKSAYEIAKNLGFTGSEVEWLESLKGAPIELRVNDGAIEWKNKDDTNWTLLINISELAGKDGNDGKEIELSTTPTHIVWRYVGDAEWTNLLEIPTLSDGKSAYEIAVELGFEGTKEEWINSLQGRGIKKIEKISSDGLVDTYRITFTDNTTFEYQITNGTNGSETTQDPIPDELVGYSFNEVLGMGYTVSAYYGDSETVIIPSEYNGKPVVAIDSFAIGLTKKIKYIVIPDSIISIGTYGIGNMLEKNYSLEAIFYNGDFSTFESIFNYFSIRLRSNKKIKLYLKDENGTVVKNGISYKELTEFTLNENNYSSEVLDFYNQFNIKTLVIDESIIDALIDSHSPCDITYFKGLSEIYFDGSFENWLKIVNVNLSTNFSYDKLFILDENGDVSHNNKKYKEYDEITLQDNINFDDYRYYLYTLPSDISFDAITLSNLSYLIEELYIPSKFSYLMTNYNSDSNYNSSNLAKIIPSNDITLYYDGAAADLYDFFQEYKNDSNYTSVVKYLKENTYVLDKSGTVTHNNKKYLQYYDTGYEIIPSYDLALQTSECVWNPLTLSQASKSYDVSGEIDAWIVYSKNFGTTYNDTLGSSIRKNPIDNITYTNGDTLPTWKAFASKLGLTKINQGSLYGQSDADNFTSFKAAKESTGIFRDNNNEITDIFYNTTANLNKLGADGDVIDLLPYVESGQMPALKKFLTDNPIIYAEILNNGYMYYTPYLDGFQATERGYVMDTTQVEKLFDNTLPSGTGLLAVGEAGDSKGLNSSPQIEPFIDSNYNYPEDTTIDIVNPATSKKVTVTVNKTTNIIKQQNELMEFGCTGVELINQFKRYAQAAYGDIINTYYDGKISKMFTSVGACYNADDLVALLRIFKANPDVLYGSAAAYDEVVPVFPRGQANNRVENILTFATTLYGVQGRGSEHDYLFFGADGKIHDFETQTASYDMLDKLHALYTEGLIEENFWYSGGGGNYGLDRYFKKTSNNPTFGLLEYDYFATQSQANDIYNGIGTESTSRKEASCGFDFRTINVRGIMPILSPLTYVSTESYTWDQSLDDKNGKTLQRYYEENRYIKNTSWSIPSGSDNISSAIALMDFMFTKEGWEIQNFGPEEYWDYGTALGQENTPIIKQEIFDHFATTSVDFWSYYRGLIGSTIGIGHYRPITLDYQVCNHYAKSGYENIELACRLGVQKTSRCGDPNNPLWSTTMPIYPFLSDANYSNYAGVAAFWAQSNKSNSTTTGVGWVAIVVNGSDYSNVILEASTLTNFSTYTYNQVKSEITNRNLMYLYAMGNSINKIPPEATQ